MPLLSALLLGFKIWMLVDVLRRGGCCGNHWYLIVILVPLGEWVYFFTIKIHDFTVPRPLRQLLVKKPKLGDLRLQFEACPSLQNRAALAEQLLAESCAAEALEHFSAVLAQDRQDKQALLGIARCQRELGDLNGAAESYPRCLGKSWSSRDLEVAAELAEVYWDLGDKPKAIDFLRKVTGQSGQARFKTQLAWCLIESGRSEEARQILNRAFADQRCAPRFLQRQNYAPLREARKMLRTLSAAACRSPQ